MAAPTVVIATVDRTRETRAYSLRYEYSLGARARAEFEIYDDDSTQAAYRPPIDARVELRHGATILFRGKILTVTDKPLGDPGVGTVTAITAVDDWAVASLRRVSASYAAGLTLKAVVSDLVTRYLAVYGLTLGAWPPSSPNGPTLNTALTFDGVTVEQAFNQLVDLSGGWIYRLNPTGDLIWFGQAHRIQGVRFSETNQNILGPITWTKSRSQHANRVLVRYGTGLVGGGQTFTGTGTQIRFPLTFPVAQVGHLTYEGGPYPPGTSGIELVGLDAATARPWYVDAATQELVRKIGAAIPGGVAAAPAPGDIIKFYYNIQFPQTVVAETAEAATFPIEAIVERADIFSPGQAQAVAQSQLDKLTAMPRTVTMKTRELLAATYFPGDSVQLDVPSRTLPLAGAELGWLITELQVTIDVDQEPTITLTLLEATAGVRLLSWLTFWRDLAGTGAGVGIVSGSVMPPPHTPTSPPPGETSSGGGGTGDVTGPASAADNALARWEGTTGKTLQGSIVTLSDAGLLTGAVLPQAGLKLQDINASHVLQINCGSNLTAERALTLLPGDASRSLTLTADSAIGGTAYVVGGPDVAVGDGGTGLSSFAPGDLLVATGPATLATLPVGLADQVLKVAAGLPAWGAPPASGYVPGGPPVAVGDGGTGIESYSVGDLLYASHPTTLNKLGIGADGDVLWSNAGVPEWAPAPEAGTGSGGDVVGPATSDDRAIPVFSGLTGKLLANTTTAKISPTGDLVISGVAQFENTVFAKINVRVGNAATFTETSISAGNITTDGFVRERMRAVAMGDWIDVPYVASNYYGNAPMVWTVEAADVLKHRYTLIGKTMVLQFALSATALSGTASTVVYIKMPIGYQNNGNCLAASAWVWDAASKGSGYIAASGADAIVIAKVTEATFALGAFHLHGQIVLPLL